ncbi:FliH/SctL family protein [Piscirickettsia litoralis]|uniref:Flagellar assembly protein FliH n=1 Tax=Piscirickettsia litoralis TaxID=1891921 RepID=A0ABX3A1E2_9GAMM|nr:hypothetical protein BGC07_06870 [Piscirickettsia litoralis]
MINGLAHPFEQVSDELKEKLLHFVMQIGEKIAKEQCQLSSKGLENIINKILEKLFSAEKINVFLNPVDFDRLKEVRELISDNIQLTQDENITVGGCIVDAGASHVDMTIESRIKNISAQIFSDHKKELLKQDEIDGNSMKNNMENVDGKIEGKNNVKKC